MTDYLSHLVNRSTQTETSLMPRPVSRFESLAAPIGESPIPVQELMNESVSPQSLRHTPPDAPPIDRFLEPQATLVPPTIGSPASEIAPEIPRPKLRTRRSLEDDSLQPHRGRLDAPTQPELHVQTRTIQERVVERLALPAPVQSMAPISTQDQETPPPVTSQPETLRLDRPSPSKEMPSPPVQIIKHIEAPPTVITPVNRPGISPYPPFSLQEKAPEPPPTIHVTIGRVEVRATSSPPTPSPRTGKGPAVMTLDEYLQRRKHGDGQ